MNSGSPSLGAIGLFLEIIGLGVIIGAFLTVKSRSVVRLRIVAFGVLLMAPNSLRAAIHTGHPYLAILGGIVTVVVVIILIRAPNMRRRS